MQELHATAKEGALLDNFLLHSDSKDLPQTGKVPVDRSGAPLQLNASFLESTDHLWCDLIQVFLAKDRL